MTKKRIILIHIAAAIAVGSLVGWIVMLYAEKTRQEKVWENEFLMRYGAVLNDVISDLGHFEEADSPEEQFSCLGAVTNDLMQLKAFMEMHVKLMTLKVPGDISADSDQSGWREAESLVWFISNDGMMDSYQIESFWADGTISEEEADILRLLKDETIKLNHDMMTSDEEGQGHKYKYALSSAEVYQRLTELLQNVRRQMIQ
ncbi:MAG: hypothetical protein K2K63_06175 [Acetatifactor sp.]|nr:hypothetical protein [Acetatifactor sp.]